MAFRTSIGYQEFFIGPWIILVISLISFVNPSVQYIDGIQREDLSLKSPSARIELLISEKNNAIELSIWNDGINLVEVKTARFALADGRLLENLEIEDVESRSVDSSWQPLYGERSNIPDRFNEVSLKLTGQGNGLVQINLVCRVYDQGVAFRQMFASQDEKTYMIEEELTSFRFDSDYTAWVSSRAQSEILQTTLSGVDGVVERPLVIMRNDSSYLALGEAGLVNFARMKFSKDTGSNYTLNTDLDGPVDLAAAQGQTPWRYVMIADSPGKLLENNYLVFNLNEPNQIEDTDWIKPGKVIREVTLTTQGGMACVDFAAEHQLSYVEFDAGWYGPEGDISSDASTITVDPKRSPGPLELQKVINYAKAKGIGVILYVNHLALEKQLDQILPLYKDWGIKGLKYGFVNVGSQEWTSWLHQAVRNAAENQLMVDIHDEYRPTGYSRTYPNLMTQEGIRGDEESPSIESTLNTLFTRMLAGAGDYTNCYFSTRVKDKMGGETGQMAKAIMLYSPWQFLYWYDRPEGSPHKKGGAGSSQGIIEEGAWISFYDQLPTIWDDTRVLEGKIGQYATIARKHGDQWFVGALTANDGRNLEVPLNFLDSGSHYELAIYKQDPVSRENREVQIERLQVDRAFVFSTQLEANSGVAMILKKI
ncbi:MAG: glycoside hydrolase family 97 catalytic domain-containing protein [Saprospiraceae bacterium]|nr:glycoside hydrolase family 97 catalytic domain-containing protein [Saprospiraceae bacterium]